MNNNPQEIAEFECPVCLMLLEQPVTTQCGHNFCRTCITSSLLSVPKCPICRFTHISNQQGVLCFRIHIKTLIQNKFPNHPKRKTGVVSADFKEMPIGNTNLGSRLVIQSATNLFPCGKQKVFVDYSQFGGLPSETIKHFLNTAQIVVLKSVPQLQSAVNDLYGVSGTILSVSNVDSKVQIDLMAEERVNVVSLQPVQFKLQVQHSQPDALDPPQSNEYAFEMLTCSGTVIRDDPININSEETNQQLKMLLDSIIEFLTKAINYQTHVPDISTATVQAALQKTGLPNYLAPGALSTQESIRKFSLILSGVLRLPVTEKHRMFRTTDVVERLILLSEVIKRYEGITNQLLIFDLDLPYHGSTSLTNNILLLVGMVFALVFFATQRYI